MKSRTLISINGFVSFLRYDVNKTPPTSRTFQKILLVCVKRVFCNSVIFVSILMAFNLFSRASACVPRAPVTNGTTFTFIFHIFFSSLARSKYFSIFSTSLSHAVWWSQLFDIHGVLYQLKSCQALLQLWNNLSV